VLAILEQITEGLAQLHQEGYAYRFLRPENILADSHSNFVLNNPSLLYNSKESVKIEKRLNFNN